jgi:hypothetical protein
LPSHVVYDLTEKNDSSLDLIEKNIAENDLVYVLTEIDTDTHTLSLIPPGGTINTNHGFDSIFSGNVIGGGIFTKTGAHQCRSSAKLDADERVRLAPDRTMDWLSKGFLCLEPS